MKSNLFSAGSPGRLLPIQGSNVAFVPNLMPPKLDLGDLNPKIESAALAIGELKGIGRLMRDSQVLVGPLINREAVFSSRIEGTIASAEQLALFDAETDDTKTEPTVREVGNYSRALRFGLERLQDLPVSQRLIRELHSELMRGVRGDDKRPGEFRTRQNWIGRNPATPIDEARFVPPPATELPRLLADWESYANKRGAYPAVVDLALLHYQFEAIHPFADGNGRVGRLLLPLTMAQWGLMPQPLLHLSPYFEGRYSDYADLMLAVSQKGQWPEWISFVLDAIAAQANEALSTSQYLLDLRDDYLSRVQTARSSALLPRLVEFLFTHPALTIPRARQVLGVSYRGAQLNVEKLVSAGIVRELKMDNGRRFFLASEIIDVTQGRTERRAIAERHGQTDSASSRLR